MSGMMREKIIRSEDIQFLNDEKTEAICRSMSDETLVYHLDLSSGTCECKGFQYCKKEPKSCKHLLSALRLRSIMKMEKQY